MTGLTSHPSAERGIEIQDLFSSIPDFALAGVFLLTWVAPTALGDRMIGYLMLLKPLEFLNVHSAAFMGSVILRPLSRGKKTLGVIGVGSFYTLFVGRSRGWGSAAQWSRPRTCPAAASGGRVRAAGMARGTGSGASTAATEGARRRSHRLNGRPA